MPTVSRTYATAASSGSLAGLTSKARAAAESISANWKGTNADGNTTKNYIGGKFVGTSGIPLFHASIAANEGRYRYRERGDNLVGRSRSGMTNFDYPTSPIHNSPTLSSQHKR